MFEKSHKASTFCALCRFQKYKGTKNKHELIEQVKREMAVEKERRERGERVMESDDEDDDVVDIKGSVLLVKRKHRGAPDETPVVPFDSEDTDPDAGPRPGTSGANAGHLKGHVSGGGGAEPDDGESPGKFHH